MIEYARWNFELTKIDKTGTTLYATLNQVWKTTKKKPEQLNPPCEIPFQLIHVWEWFLELSEVRQNYGFGISKLTYTEIHSWSTLNDNYITPFEIGIIRKLDNEFVKMRS